MQWETRWTDAGKPSCCIRGICSEVSNIVQGGLKKKRQKKTKPHFLDNPEGNSLWLVVNRIIMRNLSLLFGFEQLLAVWHCEEEQLLLEVEMQQFATWIASRMTPCFYKPTVIFVCFFCLSKSCSDCLPSAVYLFFLSKNSWCINNGRVWEKRIFRVYLHSFGGCSNGADISSPCY